jgi:hypothetical protein
MAGCAHQHKCGVGQTIAGSRPAWHNLSNERNTKMEAKK